MLNLAFFNVLEFWEYRMVDLSNNCLTLAIIIVINICQKITMKNTDLNYGPESIDFTRSICVEYSILIAFIKPFVL